MDQRTQIREFLASRRARITPSRPARPPTAATGASPGPRREEIAPFSAARQRLAERFDLSPPANERKLERPDGGGRVHRRRGAATD